MPGHLLEECILTEGRRRLGGRWLAPGESPFKENPTTARKRQELSNPNQSRNEEWARLMNSRARKLGNR